MNSDALVELVVAALMEKTAAVRNVFAPRDWPTGDDQKPVILIQSPIERKESKGRVAPAFDVTTTVRIVARIWSAANVGDQGARAVGISLGLLKGQIERAIINDYDLTRELQQFSSIESIQTVNAEGKFHKGELTMDVAMEFFQDVQDFAPIDANPLTELTLYADLVNVFDPSGPYPDSPFPDAVNDAPRTSGPDGRNEGALDITLPQEE